LCSWEALIEKDNHSGIVPVHETLRFSSR
jgi:hypothetical protein